MKNICRIHRQYSDKNEENRKAGRRKEQEVNEGGKKKRKEESQRQEEKKEEYNWREENQGRKLNPSPLFLPFISSVQDRRKR